MANALSRPEVTAASQNGGLHASALVWAMIGVVVAVSGVAYWDEERESTAALEDFAQEQATLAKSLAAALQVRLKESKPASLVPSALVEGLGAVERPAALVVLLLPPGEQHFRALDGRAIRSDPIARAIERGETGIRLNREQASGIGLPPRTAVAGLAEVDSGQHGRWRVAVVANAERLRDREQRARWRVVLATLVASGLVLTFGGTALRRQRKELDLERELAIADLQRRRDERLDRADRAATLGTFAMGIAHEISTPLGVISGRAEQLLPAVTGDERSGRAVRTILDQTERIHQVIRAFLGLARGEAPQARDLEPGEIAARALALCEHRFGRAGVSLDADVPESLPSVRGDPNLLEHALINLLLNACDACERGGHVRLAVEGGEAVAFSISDDGVGIASSDAARVTEPFFTTKPSGGGSGLGLAIVSEIAKHHRGVLTIAASPPRGTVARLEIPAAGRAA